MYLKDAHKDDQRAPLVKSFSQLSQVVKMPSKGTLLCVSGTADIHLHTSSDLCTRVLTEAINDFQITPK